MIKIGSSCGFEKYADEHYYKMKEFGYDCHDYNMPDTTTPLYTEPITYSEKVLSKIKKDADDAGIEIWQVHGPWRWPPNDLTEDDRSERAEKMCRSMYMTSLLGCKRWVVHPIMPFGIDDLKCGMAEETFKINVDFFGKLALRAKEYDITICCENMPFLDFSISKPADILRLINAVAEPNFKMCFDTGHVGSFDGELSVGDEVRRCGDMIEALHIHDTKCALDLHLLPGFGVLDWCDFSKALKDINFDGCFSLETSPPSTLPVELYHEQNVALVNIARAIIDGKF